MSYFPQGQHVINVDRGTRVIAYRVTMEDANQSGLSIEQFEALQRDLDNVMTLHLGERNLKGKIWNGETWIGASQAQLKKALDEGEDYDGPQVAIERTTLCGAVPALFGESVAVIPKYAELPEGRKRPY